MMKTNHCSHRPQYHCRSHVSAVRDESFLVGRVRARGLRRWVPILTPIALRSRTKASLVQRSAPQTSINSVLVKSPAQDAYYDPGYNSLPTKTIHVPVPVHHTHTAILRFPRTYTTRHVSMVGVALLVTVEVGFDPTFHSNSKYVAVGVARKTMKEYRNSCHSRPFQVRRRWHWDSHWGSCSDRHRIVHTIRGTPKGIASESERDIVLAVDDARDEGEGASLSETHAHNSLGSAVDGYTHRDDGVVVAVAVVVVVVVVVVHLGMLVHHRTAH